MATTLLTIRIRDYKYSANITVPSEKPPCPKFSPPLCLDGVLIPQPNDTVTDCPKPPICKPNPPELRIVKILPEDEKRLPDANNGETVKITATVICKTAETISKPKDTAYLIIDGAVADRKTIENGIVTFDWEATAVPINIHNICVKVDPSTTCKSPGQDCKRITVSPTILSIEEQLAKERASTTEQKKLLKQARSKIREEIIGAELQVPGTPGTPGTPTSIPFIPITPVITPIITSPSEPEPISKPTPTPEFGYISIIDLPSILPVTPEVPIYIYIDNKSVGRLFELPKLINTTTGTHNIYARGGDITTPTKTAVVRKDETTTISLA